MVREDDDAKREELRSAYIATLGGDVDAERRRRRGAPRMALRPDREFSDELDDIVVENVRTFRAECMSERGWRMACYFDNDERVAFWVSRETRPARIVVSATEFPSEWIDIDAERAK